MHTISTTNEEYDLGRKCLERVAIYGFSPGILKIFVDSFVFLLFNSAGYSKNTVGRTNSTKDVSDLFIFHCDCLRIDNTKELTCEIPKVW